ncbi:universal stress protein [Phreatobacter sp.]|uniref:universal stress protein n=1 Tax=Phreatobacter sp. TaxID=1966341 RepID=UPI003F7275B8
MTAKTVHVALFAPEGEIETDLLDYALALPGLRGAHIVALIGTPKLHFSFPEGGALSETVIEGINQNLVRTGQESGEALRILASARGAEVSTELVHAALPEMTATMVRRCRLGDVVVARGASADRGGEGALAEELLVGTGRPVILVPDGWRREEPEGPVLVAWDGGAKAAGAVAEALPVLKAARAVEVLIVNQAGEAGEDDLAFMDHLRRHVPHATLSPVKWEAGTVAEVIAAQVRVKSASLLVAGAYGHSRLREFVFGGTTAHLFARPPCPLLLCH